MLGGRCRKSRTKSSAQRSTGETDRRCIVQFRTLAILYCLFKAASTIDVSGPLAPPFLIFGIFLLTRLYERLVQCKLWIVAQLVGQTRVEQTYDESVPNKPVVNFPRGVFAFFHKISERRGKRID